MKVQLQEEMEPQDHREKLVIVEHNSVVCAIIAVGCNLPIFPFLSCSLLCFAALWCATY